MSQVDICIRAKVEYIVNRVTIPRAVNYIHVRI